VLEPRALRAVPGMDTYDRGGMKMDNVQYVAENFECPICKKKFTTVYEGFGHLNDKHPAGEQKEEED